MVDNVDWILVFEILPWQIPSSFDCDKVFFDVSIAAYSIDLIEWMHLGQESPEIDVDVLILSIVRMEDERWVANESPTFSE